MELKVGEHWRGKKIREVLKLSNGWYLIKTDNSKTENDFKVKTIFSLKPSRSMTPKHAHFAIDLYGKVCADINKAANVHKVIYWIWRGKDIKQTLRCSPLTSELPGYPLEYILYTLNWILEQEDINFESHPEKKQKELIEIYSRQGVELLPHRKGSHLAIALMCDIMNGTHPVEALLKANLDIRPRRRGKG